MVKMEKFSPSGIYQRVRNETEEVLKIFDESLGSSDEELASAIEDAKKSFEQEKDVCDSVLAELDRAAEWGALTIAFYGETNAGKSTIIETLRILMGEQTKKEEQRLFIDTRDRIGLDEAGIRKWEETKKALVVKKEELSTLDEKNEAIRKAREAEKENLKRQVKEIEDKIAAYPAWRRLISLIWKIPEKVQLKSSLAGLESFEAETAQVISEQDACKAKLSSEIAREEESIAAVSKAMEELAQLEDGKIIGNGESDFTRNTSRYEFSVGTRKFVLLDVPGIEGKEEEVISEIMEAVRKAHVVFYVTSETKPPEKGDKGKGTIEKIKEHLGAQTEVYTIYNKRINNPTHLDGALVNEGEKAALDVLERVMKEQLGSNYRGRLDVGAGPAFFAATDCFAPGSRSFKQRAKFAEKIGVEQVLSKSGMRGLIGKIKEDMLFDVEKKILRSNFNKANDAVSAFKSGIDVQVVERLKPLHLSLIERNKDSVSQVRSAVQAFCQGLGSDVSDVVEARKREVRKEIYDFIDLNVSNDDFKCRLESALEGEVESIGSDVGSRVVNRKEELKKKIERISEQYAEHVGGVISDFNLKAENRFGLNLNIASGIDYWAIAGAVGSGAALAFATGGFYIAVAAIGIVVSLGKAVWSFFSDDYKMSQQKKEADKHIDAAFKKILESCNEGVASVYEQAREVASRVEDAYMMPLEQLKKIISLLQESAGRLETISMEIRLKGGL
ncbi:hypothetical protein CO614_10880 [Lysobacteraceae bacterium NML120232]|nr:hypothetical protein CO614_10880 [Xanthomonadaceae bacterium NML120232]PJK11043.1 hypothetical protein CO608_00795 [Xanthomonadaceae bacterium NML08-0793]